MTTLGTMTSSKSDTNSSPPESPQGDDAAFSPAPSPWTPITPLSKVRPGIPTHISHSKSPLEAANERRKNGSGAAQYDSGNEAEEVSIETVEEYYKKQYEGQLQACLKTIRKLERENRSLSQGAGQDYLLQLENTIQTLETDNSKLSSENKDLKLAAQSWKARSERFEVELAESGKDLLAATNTRTVNAKDKHSAETRELMKDLRSAQEENSELYDKCIALQEEIDKLEASGGEKDSMTTKMQLIRLSKHTILSTAERGSLKVELSELSDRLDQQIELRMHTMGTMFFDDGGDLSRGLEVKLLEIEELKDTIRSQQDEIEALREGIDYDVHLGTRTEPTKDGTSAPLASSLENEFRKRIEVLTQELGITRDQLEKQKSYSSALKVFKDNLNQPVVGNAFKILNGKIHTMDKMILNLIAKIEEMRREFEARLLESSTGDDLVEAGDLAEKLQEVREDCGKLIILSNDIQIINHEAKEELVIDASRGQEVVEKPKIEPSTAISTLETAIKKISEPTKLEQHGPTKNRENRLVKSEPKTLMERLWVNLNEGGKSRPTHPLSSFCLANIYPSIRRKRRPNLALQSHPRLRYPKSYHQTSPSNHRPLRNTSTPRSTTMD